MFVSGRVDTGPQMRLGTLEHVVYPLPCAMLQSGNRCTSVCWLEVTTLMNWGCRGNSKKGVCIRLLDGKFVEGMMSLVAYVFPTLWKWSMKCSLTMCKMEVGKSGMHHENMQRIKIKLDH